MSNEQISWVNDFLITRLGPTLLKLGCADRHWTEIIRWFRRCAENWLASSQAEFDAVATTRIEAEARRLNSQEVQDNLDSLMKAVNIGVKARIPDRVRQRQRDVLDDAQQDALVRLLEAGLIDGRSANVAGQSAVRDAARDNLKYRPLSQMQLAKDQEGQPLPPWERSLDRESRDFDEAVWRLLGEATDDTRKRLLLAFWDERPDDFEFLISYLARRGYRTRPASQKERDRAAGIIKRLRRLADKSDA